MKKRILSLLLLSIMITSLFSIAAPEHAAGSTGGTRSYTDFFGKTIGVAIGSVSDQVTQNQFKAKSAYYTELSAGIEDVRRGRIDGFMTDLSTLRIITGTKGNEDLECLEVPAEFFKGPMGAISNDQNIIDRFNAFLSELNADGKLADMQKRWLNTVPDLESPMPDIPLTGINGTLRVATCGEKLPFSYVGANSVLKGYSIELALRFAQREGMNVEFSEMEFGGLIPAVISGKADLAIANISITEERKKSVLFTDPIYEDQFGILTLKAKTASAAKKTASARDYTDFYRKTLGVITGGLYDEIAMKIDSKPAYYTSESAAIEDVRKNRLDGFMYDLSAVRAIAAMEGNEDLECIDVPGEFFNSPMGALSIKQDIIDRFNIFLSELDANGTLTDMQNRWLETIPDLDAPMPHIPLTGKNGTLKVAVSASTMPFVYMGAGGEFKGYSAELALRFAAHENMSIEFIDMEFGGLIPYIISGKADFAIANVSITEERKKSVIFTDPIYFDRTGILALKKNVGDIAPVSARAYTDFAGKRIGGLTGAIWGQLTEEIVKGIPAYYSDTSAGIEDLRKGRLDGYMVDLSEARIITAQPDKKDLEYIEIPFEDFAAPMGVISINQDIIDRFNLFLAGLKADGTLLGMQNRWLETIPDLNSPMPDIPLTGENGVLNVALTGMSLPFTYFGANNELKGYCVELALRFAAFEGKSIEFTKLDFSAAVAYAASGKTDIFIDSLSITEERKKSVIFSDSIYDDQAAIITLKQSGDTSAKRDHTYFAGKNIANITGVLTYITTEKIGGTPVYYSDSSAAAEDVRQGRVAGFMHALSTVRAIAAQQGNDDFEVTAVPKEYFSAQVGGISQDQAVIDSFNEFLTVVKADGTLNDMQNRWFGEALDLNAPLPDIPTHTNGENGIIKIATCGDSLPYAYIGANGELNGFSVELALRYGAHIGKTVEFADVEFGGLIPYIVSGKADISLANMAITEERKQSVLFTEPFFDEQHGILALKASGETSAPVSSKTNVGSMEWLKTGIERNLLTDNRWKMIINGLGVTMLISFAAQIFGTIFGCVVCYILTRKNKFVQLIGNLYCGLIHGTPIVVLLMISYYIIFGNTNISSIAVAIAAFTMLEGAIIAQNLKGAIETVDPVEIEAARSIGFSAFKAFLTVTLPQAVRRALPAYTNSFVELVKATAIVGYIAIQDLTRAGDIIRSRTYDAYFPLLLVALIYLTVTTICVQIFKFIVKKVNRGADGAVKIPKAAMVKSAMDYKAMVWTTPKNMK